MSAMTVIPASPFVLPSRPRLRLVPATEAAEVAAPVTAAPVVRTPSPALHLTRRGRLAVTLVVAALAVVAAVVGARAAWAGSTVEAPAPTQQVQVLPGQTLWAIAAEVDPSADPRDVIAEIQQLNQLPTSSVQAGQTLLVPVG